MGAGAAEAARPVTKDKDEATQQWASAAVGAVASGATGASIAKDGEQFNRQLHQKEIEWINTNAKAFAQEQGITTDQAKDALAQQALRDVDAIWNVALGEEDKAAQNFIDNNIKGTSFENTRGEQQTLFSTKNGEFYDPSRYATESLRANPSIYKNAQTEAKARTGELLNNPEKLREMVEDKFNVSVDDVIHAGEHIVSSYEDKDPSELWIDGVKDTANTIANSTETYIGINNTDKEIFNGIYGNTAGTVIKDIAPLAAGATVVIGSKGRGGKGTPTKANVQAQLDKMPDGDKYTTRQNSDGTISVVQKDASNSNTHKIRVNENGELYTPDAVDKPKGHEEHHYATDKSSTYTDDLNTIAKEYDLEP